MDLQRSLLIGAIVLLSFMLLTEWVAFKDEKSAATEQQATRLINADQPQAETTELPDTAGNRGYPQRPRRSRPGQ